MKEGDMDKPPWESRVEAERFHFIPNVHPVFGAGRTVAAVECMDEYG